VGPLISGVIVVLIMSISPLRSVNGLLCMGVILGGFVAGTLEAKANGNRLESTRGLILGAKVGLLSALIVVLVDLFLEFAPLGEGVRAGVDYFDPIPKYIYATIYGIYDGLIDIVRRGEGSDGLEWPGRAARYIILGVSTLLFGGFGGGIAASTFIGEPTVDELPERKARTPLRAGHMRPVAYGAIQFQPAQEAEIFSPPPREASAPAAATGTHGLPAMQPVPVGRDRSPIFDEAAQRQQVQRPREPLSVAPPEVLPRPVGKTKSLDTAE
jgi:hypothetical protein